MNILRTALLSALFAVPAYADSPPDPDPIGDPTDPSVGTQKEAEPSAGCGLTRVHFDTDSAALGTEAQAKLSAAAKCLTANHRLRVTVEGNADRRGTIEHNQELGDKRAKAVAQFLEAQGVSSSQLATESFGEANPVCNENDEGCWAKNRRTAIRAACKL